MVREEHPRLEGPSVAKAQAGDNGERVWGAVSEKGPCRREREGEAEQERCTRRGQEMPQSLTGYYKPSGFCPE